MAENLVDAGQIAERLKFDAEGESQLVGGLYITDDVLYVMTGQVSNDHLPPISEIRDETGRPSATARRYWPVIFRNERSVLINVDENMASEQLRETCLAIRAALPGIRALGIGGYGPFESVDVADREKNTAGASYGRILPSSEHERMRGVNVFEIANDAFAGLDVDVRIHTDVAVSAFAETVFDQYNRFSRSGLSLHEFYLSSPHRDWLDRHEVACVKVSVGVGGAVIPNREFWPPHRSTEIGSARITLNKEDTLFDRHVGSISAEDLLSEAAIRRRLSDDDTYRQFVELGAIDGVDPNIRQMWTLVADYTAQLCLNIRAFSMPERIVLLGKHMRPPGVIELVRHTFRTLAGASSPVPRSPKSAWDSDAYIAGPSREILGLWGAALMVASYLERS